MPELPDIVVYMEALEERVVGHALENLEVRGPALLRTADPPIYLIQGHRVTTLRRVGKRIAFGFDNDLWLVFHLMIAGRLHWSQKKKTADGRRTLAAFDFDNGTLTLTEAGARKRASLHLVKWTENLRKETGAKFPEKVTAFRDEMAVHGRYGKPCPRCGAKVQRTRYASNETDYCPHCQTGGKLLADRSLSRLLRQDWPRTPEELEELRRG
jgi:formamidopyrimidine-DNA glycosylase